MTPHDLHQLLAPSVIATLEGLRGALALRGLQAGVVEDFGGSASPPAHAIVAWGFDLAPSIEVDIQVLFSQPGIRDDTPVAACNFVLEIHSDHHLICAYQPCKFTTRQWVPTDDFRAVETRYALFAEFCDGAADFIADHLRVRTAAKEHAPCG